MSTYPRPGVYVSESLLPSTRVQSTANANAAGAVVGTFPKGPTDVTYVQSWYDFTALFGGLNSSYPGTYQVQSFFQNGGRELYCVRLLSADAVSAAAVVPKDGLATPAVTFTTAHKGADTNNLRVTVTLGSAADKFNIVIAEEVAGVSGLVPVESYDDVVVAAGDDNVATVVNAESQYVTAVVDDPAAALDLGTVPFTGGTNGTAIAKTDYVPETGDDAFAVLSLATRPLVLFLPSLHADITESVDRSEIYSAAVAWAEANYGFVVADTVSGLSSLQAVTAKAEVPDSAYVAMYWPNVVIADPLGRSRRSMKTIAPGGAVAGQYLGTDSSRGVFKTPAGLDSSLAGAVSLERALSATDLNTLYAGQVNAIRQVPGSGLVIMGGKTAKAARQADQNVAIRRSLSFLEKYLYDITEFAIFENNTPDLWARLNTVCSVFLSDFWRAGGLAGTTETTAFYVKVDKENNTLASIQNGEVHIEVGVSLQYPAEFIVIRLSQQAGV